MGNKISLGKCVIYCGFPGQRKKTKQKEVEQRRKEEELERYEIWLRAEKFKADFPEYCIKAGIAPSSLVPSAHHSEQTSEESRRTKAHCASTLKAPENERLKPRTIYSDGTTSISDEHCNQESPAGLLPIPVINTCKKLRILHKIPSLRVPAEIEQQAGVYELGNVKPENKKIVTVRSIYKKNQNGKKNVCKLGEKLAYSEVFNLPFHSTLKPVPSPDESFQPKPSSSRQPPPPVPCDISSLRPLTPVPSPSPEPSDSSYDRPSCCPLRSVTFNTTSSDNFQDCFQSSSASSSSDTTVSLKKNQRFVSDVVKTQETEDEARGDSTRVRALAKVFNLHLNSTLKPVPTPDESSQPKPSSSHQPLPPVPRDISSLRPLTPVSSPSPEPSDSSHDRPSCCPLRSVTFNTTSSDDFQDCFQSSSASSSSDTTVSLKTNKQFVADVVKTQETENEARGDSSRVRALAMMKPSKDKLKRSLPPSFKWNGRCVFDSGYPSLMVGDCIESASEDEEFWEKRLANVVQTSPVKRHVFGLDIPHKHDLISAQELYQDFNANEVDVYLKERREQCNRWLFGVDPKTNGYNQYPTNVRGTENTSNAAIVPLGFEPPSQFTSLPMPDKLRNLHNELRELRNESKHLRTGLPRIIKSIERRQRMLEARVDVFASRGAFMSFQEAGDENVKQKLKALHDDLEQLKYKDTQRREHSNHDMVLKREEDIFVEDIEAETRTLSRNNEKKHKEHQSKICDPEKSKHLIRQADDHSVIPNPTKVQARLQQKAQLNNSNNTITTNGNINIESKYNQLQTDTDVQARDFTDNTKKVICMEQNLEVVSSILTKDTGIKLCDETTLKRSVPSVHYDTDYINNLPVSRNATSEYQEMPPLKDQFNNMLENDIRREASLKQIVTFKDRNYKNGISDVHSVPPEPQLNTILCPTVMAGAIDQQAPSAKTLGGPSDRVITKRLGSSEVIDKDIEDMMTVICQDKSATESETNIVERKSVGEGEKDNINGRSCNLVGGFLFESNDRHINSSSMLNMSVPRNSATDIATDIMLTGNKIVKQNTDVVGIIEVDKSNLDITNLKESIPHTLQSDCVLDRENIVGNGKSSIGVSTYLAGSNDESITSSSQSRPTTIITDGILKTSNMDASVLIGANNMGINSSSKTGDVLTGNGIKKTSDKEQTSQVSDTTQQGSGFLSRYDMDTVFQNQNSDMEDILRHRIKTLVSMGGVKSTQGHESRELDSLNTSPDCLQMSPQIVKDNEELPSGIEKCLSTNDASKSSHDKKNKISNDLKTISFESERNRISFLNEDLVFRKYLRKFHEQPKTSRSSEVCYLSDQMLSDHEENIGDTDIGMNVVSEIESEIQSGLLDDELFSNLPKKSQYSTAICSSHNLMVSNIESEIMSGMHDDQVVSKLHKDSQCSKAIHSSQLISDSEDQTAYLDVQTGHDVASGNESEIVSRLGDDEVLSDGEKQDPKHSVEEITFGNDGRLAKVNFNKSGVEFEANQPKATGQDLEGVSENEAVRTVISCQDSVKEAAEIEHGLLMENKIVQDELQQGLGKEFKTNLRPIVSESGRERVNFSKNNLVFRNDIRKMKLPKDFQSSEPGSSCDQVVVGTKGMITTENNTKIGSDVVSEIESEIITYNTKDSNSIIGIYKDKDFGKGIGGENNKKCYDKTDLDESIKKLLDDDLERNVVDREAEVSGVAEIESKETEIDVLDRLRKVRNGVINEDDEEIVQGKRNDVLENQIERERDEDYYELGDFDKIVEEMLDDGFKNMDEGRTLEKCVPGLMLPEIQKGERFTGQEFNDVLVNDKMLTKVNDGIDEDYKTKYVIKQDAEKEIESTGNIDDEDILNFSLFDEDFLTQVEQHKTGSERVFKVENTWKPRLGEKLNLGRNKLFRQNQKNINVVKDFNDVEDNIVEDQQTSTRISYQNLHVARTNVSDLAMNDNSNRTERKYRVLDKDEVRNVHQDFAEEELYDVENAVNGEGCMKVNDENQSGDILYEMEKQRNKGPLCGLQSQEPKVLHSELMQEKFEYISPKMELPYPSTVFTNLQINSLPSFTKSLARQSTFQEDSTTTSLEQSSSDRKSPNLVIPDMDTTCSEYMSSPEPSLQESAFYGQMNFKTTVERDILAQSNNSSSSDCYKNMPLPNYSSYIGGTFPFHENIKCISRSSERNISPEDKSGYISEAEFDTSFSDNLSYVEGGLVEDIATVEEIEEFGNEKLFEHETEAKFCLTPGALSVPVKQSLQKQEPQVSNDVPIGAAEAIQDNSSEHLDLPGKSNSRNSFDVENNLQHEALTHPEVSRTKLGEDLNIMIDGTRDTNQTQSLANVKSSFQETEMPEIESQQKGFKEIIFGNVDVVAITPGKQTSSVQNLCDVRSSEVKDVMFANEQHSGQNLGHIGLVEQSLKSKQSSYQKMNGGTSESTCDEFYSSHSEVTPGYDELSACNRKVTPSTKEPTSEYNDGVTLSNNRINPGYNDVTPSYDHVITSSYNEVVPEKDEVSADNFSKDSVWLTAKNNDNILAKEKVSADETKNVGCQNISLEDDVELCRENLSSESEDVVSAREHEFERQNLTEGKIITNEVNTFPRQIIPSGDDLKLHLHSSEEEELNRHPFIESRASDNEIHNVRRPKIALEEDLVFQSDPSSEDVYPSDGFHPNEEKEVGRKSLLETKISKDGVKDIGRQKIALEDDFVLCSEDSLNTSRNIHSSEATETSKPMFIESSISEDEIKNIRRQKMALEDDFVLRGDDSSSARKYNPKNEKIALKDGFSSRRELVSGETRNKGNEFDRQVINNRNHDGDKANNTSNSNVSKESKFKFKVDLPSPNKDSGLKTPKREDKMDRADEDMIADPDYQLNTLSDISSISDDMSMGGETSNRSHENVTEQEANRYRGFNKDTLLATNQIDDSTNLNNREDRNILDENPNTDETMEEKMTSGLAALFAGMRLNDSTTALEAMITPSPPPKRTSPDPNSYAMTQLRNIMRGIKPTNATRQVATQKILQKELEKQQKEQDEKLYESKERGTRCLEKLRDDVFLKPRSASPRRQVSYSGFGATLQLPTNGSKLQSRSASGIGYGAHIENNVPAMGNSIHNHIQYHVNRDPSPNIQHIPPAYDPYPQPSEDEDSYLDDICPQQNAHEGVGLERSQTFCGNDQNNIRLKSSTNSNRDLKTHYDLTQQSSLNVNQLQAEPAYRTPDYRRPAALVPLNVRTSAPNLASKVASFQAALGFGPSDPWKPKALPDIEQEGLTPRRSDSLLKQKPLPVPRLTTSMKPPALPGIGERPQMRRPLPGILSDRAL